MSIHRLFGLLVALVLIAGGILIVRAQVPASASVADVNAASGAGFDLQRTQEADAARWVAMGEAYAKQAQEAARVQRAQAADTARWVAMGKFYAKLEAERIQSNQDAETARWQALGEFYASPAQKAQRIQQAQNADAARWQALGEFYARLQVIPNPVDQ